MKKLEFPLVVHDKKSKIDFFLASREYCFDVPQVMTLYNSLLALPEERVDRLTSLKLVSPVAATLLSLFLGIFAADRFYCRNGKLGVAKLFSLAACGFWWLADIFAIRSAARKANADAAYGDERHAVGRGDGVADDGVGVHHFPKGLR